MKKLILSFSFTVAALAATAAVESSNTFGVLKVASNQAQTIICVPWVAVGTASSVNVTNLVMSSNLA